MHLFFILQNDCKGEQSTFSDENIEPMEVDTYCADLSVDGTNDAATGEAYENDYKKTDELGSCLPNDEEPHNEADIDAEIETAERRKMKIMADQGITENIPMAGGDMEGVCAAGGVGEEQIDLSSTKHFKEEWLSEIEQNPLLDVFTVNKHKDWFHYMHNPINPDQSRYRCRICHDYKKRFPQPNSDFLSEIANEGYEFFSLNH